MTVLYTLYILLQFMYNTTGMSQLKPPFPHTPSRRAHGHLYVNTVMKGRVKEKRTGNTTGSRCGDWIQTHNK